MCMSQLRFGYSWLQFGTVRHGVRFAYDSHYEKMNTLISVECSNIPRIMSTCLLPNHSRTALTAIVIIRINVDTNGHFALFDNANSFHYSCDNLALEAGALCALVREREGEREREQEGDNSRCTDS